MIYLKGNQKTGYYHRPKGKTKKVLTSAKITAAAEAGFHGQGHEEEIHMLTSTRMTQSNE